MESGALYYLAMCASYPPFPLAMCASYRNVMWLVSAQTSTTRTGQVLGCISNVSIGWAQS